MTRLIHKDSVLLGVAADPVTAKKSRKFVTCEQAVEVPAAFSFGDLMIKRLEIFRSWSLPATAATFGIVSGILSTLIPGIVPLPIAPVQPVLVGVWFALAVIVTLQLRTKRPISTLIVVGLATLVAWFIAYNLAVMLHDQGLAGSLSSLSVQNFAAGFVAGGVGAILTGVAVAWATRHRQASHLLQLALVGSILGLLLPFTDVFESLLVLFVPWQAAVAGLLAFQLGCIPSVETANPPRTPLNGFAVCSLF